MMKSRLWLLAPAALMMASVSAPALAADPTVSAVYAAARGGDVDKAISMMNTVLKDHPGSAKAHYVQAELLASKGRLPEARSELATAEKLAPGLPGIQPQSVASLKAQLNGAVSTAGTVTRSQVPVPQPSHGFPWMTAIVICILVFVLLAFLRRRNAPEVYQPPVGGGYNPNGFGSGGYGPQGGPGMGGGFGGGYGGGYPPQQGGGLGSGIMGGLATGAAAGVGFAAGERIIDGMFGNHDRERVVEREVVEPRYDAGSANQDMGGNDFGISDDSSWDDSSGGGSDDW